MNPTDDARPRLSSAAAGVLTFLAAASVLVLEIAAGRLLAPYVGVSLTTYTGIIGVILAGIAAGAWTGGRAADLLGPVRLLGPTFVAGGLAAMASVPIVALVGALGLGNGVGAIVVLAGVGFVAPATILSAVAPMIVRATIVDVATSGALVGRLSSVGTAGAIVGTFLTGFVLLGLIPTRILILGVGGLLVLVGAGLGWRAGRSRSGVVVGIVAATVLGGFVAATPSQCDRESRYYCIAVLVDPLDLDRRTLVLDDLWHAQVDVGDPTVLGFRYVRWFADASASVLDRRAELDVVHIGGGGFSFPRYVQALRPDSRHTILELDPAVLEVASTELGFTPSERARVVLGDAALSIRDLPGDAFDLAVGDAFGGLSVPWHLTTREFLIEVERILRPDGRYVLNIIDGPSLRFARAEAATLRAVFDAVAVIADPATVAGRLDGSSNVVLVASDAPLELEHLRERLATGEDDAATIAGAQLAAFAAGAPILTQDFAPVDQLIGR